MMAKDAIQWLEEQTGQKLDRPADLPEREALDAAIAALDEMRRRLPPSAA